MRYILSLILILVLGSVANANTFGTRLGGPAASSGCTTQTTDGNAGTSNGGVNVARFGTDIWNANRFVARDSGTYTICKATFFLSEVGDTSGLSTNLIAYIYSDSGGGTEPGSQIGTGSDAVAFSSIQGTETTYDFEGMSAEVTNGTTYWLVLKTTANDSTNYASWAVENTGVVPEQVMKDGDGVAPWALANGSNSAKMKLWK